MAKQESPPTVWESAEKSGALTAPKPASRVAPYSSTLQLRAETTVVGLELKHTHET